MADAELAAWQQAEKLSPANAEHHGRCNSSESEGNFGTALLSHGTASGEATNASTPHTRAGTRSDGLQASASPASTRRRSNSSIYYSSDRTSFAKSPGARDGGIGSPGSRNAPGPPALSLTPHRPPAEASEESEDSEAADGGADDATALVLEHSACQGEGEWGSGWACVPCLCWSVGFTYVFDV